MALKEVLQKLGSEKSNPCVTISLKAHRTHPDNAKDKIRIKNLLKEAEERVTKEFDKRSVAKLLDKIATIQDDIDVNYNLDSLHLFLSNDTKEIVKTPGPMSQNKVHISETFAIRPLINTLSRSEPYLIMLLSQSGVQLYEAISDGIIQEIKNGGFPFTKNIPEIFFPERKSDAAYLDDLVRGYFNKIDKALVKVHNETGLNCVVVCTADNYSFLTQVADKPNIYNGYVRIDYNNRAPHQIVKQTWELMRTLQQQQRTKAINEMKGAVASGKVLTDLQEIYQAAIDGRGDLLIVHQDFVQPVLMTGERTFDLIDDVTTAGAIDDITSKIAWEILTKHGRALFTAQDEIKDLGKIVLKTRY